MTDGYWYHGNGKIGGEFHPTKPNDEERYGEYVKIKHGRWILNRQGNWACSLCGNDPYHDNMKNMNYCPNCGSKMDGGEE